MCSACVCVCVERGQGKRQILIQDITMNLSTSRFSEAKLSGNEDFAVQPVESVQY